MENVFKELLHVGKNAFYKINTTRGNKEIFYDKKRSNLIVFNPCEEATTEQVMAFTHAIAFQYLAKKLYKRRNYVVYWNQNARFAKSEWIIFRSQDVEALKLRSHGEIIDILNDSIIEVDDSIDSRFNVVDKDGILIHAKIKTSQGELIY